MRVRDVYVDDEENVEENNICFLAFEEPTSVEDAQGNASYRNAIEEKMKSIINNKTWEHKT